MRRAGTLSAMLVLSFVGALQAQSPNASVTGRVTDTSKAAVEDAKVTLINKGTNIRYEGKTNETGSYYVTDLPIGTYSMEVEKTGFRTVIKPDVVLHVQDVLEINFDMALGSVSESITVEAGAPSIQLTTSSISAVVNSQRARLGISCDTATRRRLRSDSGNGRHKWQPNTRAWPADDH
jgi:hypothetical protein